MVHIEHVIDRNLLSLAKGPRRHELEKYSESSKYFRTTTDLQMLAVEWILS